jgi:type I restriction enzyme S subunit
MQSTLFDDATTTAPANGHAADDDAPTDDLVKTPMGPIPRDWELVKVEDFGRVVTGTTPPTKEEANYGDEYLFVTPGDLEGKYVAFTERGLSARGLEASRPVPAGSVFFTCIGSTIGKAGVATERSSSNQQINAVVTEDKEDGEYLYYALRFNAERIRLQAGTQAVPMINKSDFSTIRIPSPPKAERGRIADVLATWDRALATLDARREAAERRKRALMQQLLTGATRLPEFEGEPWVEVKLGELFDERKEKDRGDLDLLAITMGDGIIDRDELDRRDTSNSDKSNYLRVAPGDIAYNSMRMWQGVCGLSELEGIVSPAYTVCVPRQSIDGHFASYLFKHPRTVYDFLRYSQGLVSDTLTLRFSNFAEIKVRIPATVEEQRAIAEILSACDAEIEALASERAALARQKRGLMQKLLTGRVRVPEASA